MIPASGVPSGKNQKRESSGPPDSSEAGSVPAFAGMLLIILFAVSWPEAPVQALQGILWAGCGALMLLFPPKHGLPRFWLVLAAGFLVASFIGFLPGHWFSRPPWRQELEMLGQPTGAAGFLQPGLAAETFAEFAFLVVIALYLLGHRVGMRSNFTLALAFTVGVGLWTAVALARTFGGFEFGFFPNRNHTATLLVMGALCGIGCLAQAIRLRAPGKVLLAFVPAGLCLVSIAMISESRAGVILVAGGVVAWFLLVGREGLGRNVGRMVLVAGVALVGLFLVSESAVKSRLLGGAPQPPVSANATPMSPRPGGGGLEVASSGDSPHTESRVLIYRDAWKMISHEPWTGVGPGQFAYVFPQYRAETNAGNDSRCYHPESDWLWMLAEVGWPAVACLAGGVISVLWAALSGAVRGRSRALRMGCIVAALAVAVHGLVDVPGHRPGLALGAIFLAAISLRAREDIHPSPVAPFPTRALLWRVAGAFILLVGIWLLAGQIEGRSVLPSRQVAERLETAKDLYERDLAAYQKAAEEGSEYRPATDVDPLEEALRHIEAALETQGLDPEIHHFKGLVALHFDDKQAVVDTAFEIERHLLPTVVKVPLSQANAWSSTDAGRVEILWKEALERAARDQVRSRNTVVGTDSTYARILKAASQREDLWERALNLSLQDPELGPGWTRLASAPLIDRAMPWLIVRARSPEDRAALWGAWQARGTRHGWRTFVTENPDMVPGGND